MASRPEAAAFMILEALTYLITPCPPVARRMGFLKETVSIISRHGRCKRAWEPHLASSREVVLKAVERTRGNRRAVILGAGLGYDLPLAELAWHFAEVLLVDLVHGPGLRLSSWRYRNVRLVTHDVTESLENFTNGRFEARKPARFLDDPTVDLVVSLNLISQLPPLPAHYLEGPGGMTEASADALGRALVEAHLAYLRDFQATVCLIGDLEREIIDADGAVIETVSALRGATMPWLGEIWRWEIAPLGEEDSGYAIHNRVIGIPSISEAEAVR